MSGQEWLEANRDAHAKVPRLGIPLLILVLLGIIGFALASGEGIRAWQAYWVNFLFFAGIAQAGVIIAAIVYTARGQWGGTLVRLGLLQVSFIPITLALFIGILIGAGQLLPWALEPVAGKEWWLELNFFMIRNSIALVLLAISSVAFAYFILRPEAGALAEAGLKTYPNWLIRNWRGTEKERERSRRVLSWLAPLLLIIYGLAYTLIGFDMVMSLDPHWYSNLFGAYFFITTLYMGLAALVIVAALMRRILGLENELDSKRFHDAGKLLFAFCLLASDFLWSQFLVIWYGDLPEEIGFVIRRLQVEPWVGFSYAVFFGGFVLPFIILLNRRVKQIPLTLAIVALIVLVGGFSERLLMVLPSLHPEPNAVFPIGVPEGLITLGFIGLYGLSLLWMLRRAPIVPGEPLVKGL